MLEGVFPESSSNPDGIIFEHRYYGLCTDLSVCLLKYIFVLHTISKKCDS